MSTPTTSNETPTPPVAPVVIPAAPKKTRKWPWVLLVVFVGLIVIGVASGGGHDNRGDVGRGYDPGPSIGIISTGNAIGDVSVTPCTVETTAGLTEVTATVHNTTSSVQSYMVTVSVNDATGNRVTEVNGAANAVAPGQSAPVQLIGSSPAVSGSAKSCTVADVTRIPS